MAVRPEAERVMVTLSPEEVEFVDKMADKLDRSRSWCVATALYRWRQKLEKDAERRQKKRVQRAQEVLGK